MDLEKINSIKDRSVLSFIPDEKFGELIDKCQTSVFPKGEIISASVGLKTLVMVTNGSAEMVDKISGSRIETLGPGKSFELGTLVSEKKRWLYDWVATSEVTALLIPFDSFTESVDEQYITYLKRITQNVELQKLKNDLRLIGVEESRIRRLITKLDRKSWGEAEKSIHCLFVISDGHIEFSFNGYELITLNTSDYFLVKDAATVFSKHLNDVQGWIASPELLSEAFFENSSVEKFIDIIQEKILDVVQVQENVPEEIIQEAFGPIEEDDLEAEHFYATDKEIKKDKNVKPVLILQHDMMDCAAACMSMISKFYNKKISVATWRSIIHVTREGASMLSVKKGCTRVGFDATGFMVSFNGMKKFKFPLIALMSYHYVVVYKIEDEEILIADPEKGLITLSRDRFLEDYSGNILAIRSNKKLSEFPESKNQFSKYWFFVTDHKRAILEIFLFCLISLVLSLIHPMFLQFIFDNVLFDKNIQGLHFFAGIAVLINCLIGMVNFSKTTMMNKFSALLNAKFSTLLYRHVLKLPLDFFAVRNVGDITSRIGELEKIQNFVSEKAVNLFINLITIILYAIVLYFFHPSFILLLSFCSLVLIVVIRRYFKQIKGVLQQTFATYAKSFSIAFEQVRALKAIHNMSGTLAARWRWESVFNRMLEQRYTFQSLVTKLMTITVVSQQILTVLFLVLSIWLYSLNELSLGQIVAISALSGSLIRPYISLISDLDDIDKVKVSLEKIDELITARTENSTQIAKKDIRFEQIEFRDVWFRYGGDLSPWTLKGINLKINKGEVIAFVGPSGSGKSTLAYMLNLLYEPVKGQILIDDVDVNEIPLSVLRTNISIVLQDQASFSGSILENIAIGDTSPNLKRAIESATIANAHEFISSLPKAYMTELGDAKQGLSGGQHQRLNIARAIYKDPKILILDEATSALDTITEKSVVKNLKAVSSNKTTFIIAHRLNTIVHADKIVVIKNGSIVEIGTHGQLLSNHQGVYYNLFKKQIST